MATAREGYENPEDRSHRAHTLHTTLFATQELIVVELSRLLESPLDDPLDDPLVVTRRSGTSSCNAKDWAVCAPFHIRTILTDNGTQFTDRFTSRQKQPSGNHVFDLACASAHIAHRLIPPRHPQNPSPPPAA
jgi:hypothetical protein